MKLTFKQHRADRGLRWATPGNTGTRASFGYTFLSNSRAFCYNFGGTVSLHAHVFNDQKEVEVLSKNLKARTRAEADKAAREEFRKLNIRQLLAVEAAKL